MSTAAPARGQSGKSHLKCGFNQLCSDTQLLSFVLEVPNETALFSFHLTKAWLRQESPDWARSSRGGRQIWGAGLDGAVPRHWSCRAGNWDWDWELGIGLGMLSVYPKDSRVTVLAGWDTGTLVRLCRCEWLRESFSPVIPNALPAELASFPPAFCCLLQVVGKGLFPFLFPLLLCC